MAVALLFPGLMSLQLWLKLDCNFLLRMKSIDCRVHPVFFSQFHGDWSGTLSLSNESYYIDHFNSDSIYTNRVVCKLVTTWKTCRPRPCALFFQVLFADSLPILSIPAPRLPETAVFGALIFVGLKAALGTQLWESWLQAQRWQALVGQRYRNMMNMSKDKRPD